MATFKRPSDTALREEVMESERRMTALRVRLTDPKGTLYPDDGLRRAAPDGGAASLDRLARLEAGDSVRVQGWQLGFAQDFTTYDLDGDGRLTPVEPADGDLGAG